MLLYSTAVALPDHKRGDRAGHAVPSVGRTHRRALLDGTRLSERPRRFHPNRAVSRRPSRCVVSGAPKTDTCHHHGEACCCGSSVLASACWTRRPNTCVPSTSSAPEVVQRSPIPHVQRPPHRGERCAVNNRVHVWADVCDVLRFSMRVPCVYQDHCWGQRQSAPYGSDALFCVAVPMTT